MNDEPEDMGAHSTGRNRRSPAWLEDYVTDEANFVDAEQYNLVVSTPSEDPTTLEEAVKESKWRKAIHLWHLATYHSSSWSKKDWSQMGL